jgi:hypothetical protein
MIGQETMAEAQTTEPDFIATLRENYHYIQTHEGDQRLRETPQPSGGLRCATIR